MIELNNHTEVLVRKVLQDYLSKNAISCSCERCQADIMTLALNRLPSRYFSSSQGEIFTQLKSQADQVPIISEVVRAIQLIKASPSHPIGQP
ncbi:MAG: competence protein ComFB [Desulfosporosinus sp. BRH_c37]|nr:MAG: competence protein ComFB [Desulfosporosinus sp. BRH_c37]